MSKEQKEKRATKEELLQELEAETQKNVEEFNKGLQDLVKKTKISLYAANVVNKEGEVSPVIKYTKIK